VLWCSRKGEQRAASATSDTLAGSQFNWCSMSQQMRKRRAARAAKGLSAQHRSEMEVQHTVYYCFALGVQALTHKPKETTRILVLMAPKSTDRSRQLLYFLLHVQS